MPSSRLILARHGQTAWNLQGRLQGQLDSPLNETGVAQAYALAERLSGFDFYAIYSSDLGRAMETSGIVSERTGRAVRPDERLRERNMGILQGLTAGENLLRHREEYEKFLSWNPDYAVPDGESDRQMQTRVVDCMNDLARRHDEETVVVITHGGVLFLFLKHILGIPLDTSRRFSIHNAAINSITMDTNGRWMLEILGDITHLDRSIVFDDQMTIR